MDKAANGGGSARGRRLVAFVSGLTGQFYRQFGITIAASTIISTFNSLTLSPALAALLLQPKNAPPDAFQRGINRVLGGFFSLFNHGFERASDRYGHGVRRITAINIPPSRSPAAIAIIATPSSSCRESMSATANSTLRKPTSTACGNSICSVGSGAMSRRQGAM